MIHFKDVTVSADNKTLLDNISLSLESGDKVVLTGKSGSGKTTVLLTLLGVHVPDSGSLIFQGAPVTQRNISFVRRSVAFIGQEPIVTGDTISDALMMPFQFKANRQNRPQEEQIVTTLKSLELEPDILTQNPGSISGGEKQRIAVARALLMGKNIFLADEITSALDAESRNVITELLLRPEFTVLAVSHDEKLARRFDYSVVLEKGRIKELSQRADGAREKPHDQSCCMDHQKEVPE